ncbi:MAG TPA: cation:proton antiporter [Vicinamibacteria bacterium]|nr:cation:proton antiporter [Vicinamibacteria bacterium]
MFDPERFLVQLVVIVAAARAVGWIAARLGQPRVVGEIAAGLLLGPSLLGRLAPALSAWLFPPATFPVLLAVSHLGLLFFMFLVGLHLDLGQLRAAGRTAVATSPVSIVVPLALGIAVAGEIQPRFAPEVAPAAFALFMGVALSVTAFPVLARILEERGLTGTRLGVVAIACAAVDDVTAWCLLAGVTAYVRASAGGSSFARTVVFLAVFAAAALILLPPLLKKVIGRSPAAFLPVAVVCLLAGGAITEAIGVHALFGAFLAGIAMPRGDDLRRDLASSLEAVTSVVLLPLFFASTGLRLDLGWLRGAAAWSAFVWILLAAVGGKLGGSMLAARASGMGWREAAGLGVLLNTRGLVELVILSAGLELGVLTPPVYSMMVLMALVTTAMTTPVLQALGLARR